MSNQADLLYARDEEELEGALLPVATAVGQNDSNTTTSIATVIPSTETVFNYDTALQHEYQLQEEEAVAIPDNGSTLNYAGVADDSKTTVSRAQTAGKISSEEEIQSIRKANQKVFSHNYFEKQSFKAANARAKQRDREGMDIQNDHIEEQLAAKAKAAAEAKKQSEASQQSKEYQPKGYQISDYDCGSYETSDYQISEYKSIYDWCQRPLFFHQFLQYMNSVY